MLQLTHAQSPESLGDQLIALGAQGFEDLLVSARYEFLSPTCTPVTRRSTILRLPQQRKSATHTQKTTYDLMPSVTHRTNGPLYDLGDPRQRPDSRVEGPAS